MMMSALLLLLTDEETETLRGYVKAATVSCVCEEHM